MAVFIDWLRLSSPRLHERCFFDLERVLEMEFGATGECRRVLGYQGRNFLGLGFLGFRPTEGEISAEERPADGGELLDVLLEVPGELCAMLGAERLVALCRRCEEWGFYATRVDVAYDLCNDAVTVKKIEALFARKQVVTRADKRNAISGKASKGEKCSLESGGTLRIGGRQSQSYMKVYDKREEHMQKTGQDIGHCTRFELEIKGEKAKAAFRYICDGEVDTATGEVRDANLASLLKDHICFFSDRDCTQACSWWSEIASAPAMVWPKYEEGVTLESVLKWLRMQVMPTIKALVNGGFEHDLRKMLANAKPSEELTEYLDARGKLKRGPGAGLFL